MKFAAVLATALSAAAMAHGKETTAGQDFCCIVNAIRAEANQKPLKWSKEFDNAATDYVEWMRKDADKEGDVPKGGNVDFVKDALESSGLTDTRLTTYYWYNDSLDSVEKLISKKDILDRVSADDTLCGGSMEDVQGSGSRYFAAIYGSANGDADNGVELECKNNRALGTEVKDNAGHINSAATAGGLASLLAAASLFF
ncbi:hypothetical protein GGF46_004206 [Coemansia sp. RSA 552]|nr:hypothetical protein GGF46_004206 [Coemansia sp. RSA 552]